MKKFDLEKALKGAPLCTRKGYEAEIVVKKIRNYLVPDAIGVLVHYPEFDSLWEYKKDGTPCHTKKGEESGLDLFMEED